MEYTKPLFFHVMSYARSADRDVIDMVSGDPDWEAPAALVDGLRDYAGRGGDEFQYPPSEGLAPLREEIAARRGVSADRIVITNGAGEANYLAMAEALDRERGREVILTDPVYPYYVGKTSMLGGSATYVPADADGRLDPSAVRDAASDATACIVINSPNNPTGAVYEESTVRRLVSIAEEVDAVLVSDEVYDHFDYSGRFTSAVTVDSPNLVVSNSFSKSMAITGFRVGYGILPDPLVEGAKTRHMLVNVTGSRPAQYAVYRALQETDPEYYARTRRLLLDRIDSFTDSLAAAGAEFTRPDGAFYVMARFPELPGTLENTYRLIDEAGVAGMPGEVFGETRADWFRFALVTPRVDEAATRLRRFFE